ncbi:indoleacetate decarboxylase activase [Clostridium botulinum]|uniref:Pyruvate formate lyase-activating protein n=1 Tax=Clostridium botulinum TaxID=1491 RepID=A0A9Q1ZB65_CLOBO|nr:indoleacetate decarboxylase activase [Clostridium botulinum]AEB76288.1 pyruvate formate-lyase-activating enzyme [Clostridium botulinum BKT015925]KEH99992.1 pyruvate formate lyase-activating protein [Clostridium botulinum D str. 16868]KEI04256.1 pyruvate formate lyase-activating protein [Clostridium botulinum C/D str. Sp77]KLU75802.1 pyruvate formate lyase-activating protein [Clostridium botulinum V891]KOA75010.1 pyruvate formate lyase-activating protein [Clostridium botulinum]
MIEFNKIGTVFDIQSFSLHDGPGIRTLIFLKGCPLKCLWCANPEGQNLYPEIFYDSNNCLGCLECVKICNMKSISYTKDSNNNINIKIDRDICSKCKTYECTNACYNNALKVSGKNMSITEIMKIIKRDLPYYRNEGGITLSGGDPTTFQSSFALELLKACKDEFINTAIETSMSTSTEIIKEFIPVTDMFLADIKHMDTNKHKKLTGVSNSLILKNISLVSKYKPILVRIPIIPGFNDDNENIICTANFCKSNNISKINILPYHKLGESKYRQLNIDYNLNNVLTPNADKMNHVKNLIENVGVTCII